MMTISEFESKRKRFNRSNPISREGSIIDSNMLVGGNAKLLSNIEGVKLHCGLLKIKKPSGKQALSRIKHLVLNTKYDPSVGIVYHGSYFFVLKPKDELTPSEEQKTITITRKWDGSYSENKNIRLKIISTSVCRYLLNELIKSINRGNGNYSWLTYLQNRILQHESYKDGLVIEKVKKSRLNYKPYTKHKPLSYEEATTSRTIDKEDVSYGAAEEAIQSNYQSNEDYYFSDIDFQEVVTRLLRRHNKVSGY